MTKDTVSQVVQASLLLGHAVYYLPEWQRTGLLGLLDSGVAKDLANHALQDAENKLGPSPADRPFYGLSLALALEAMAPTHATLSVVTPSPYASFEEPKHSPQPSSDTEGMVQEPPVPR
jgi:hypothetical protein